MARSHVVYAGTIRVAESECSPTRFQILHGEHVANRRTPGLLWPHSGLAIFQSLTAELTTMFGVRLTDRTLTGAAPPSDDT